MFLNLTNHPAEHWDEKQKTAAQTYGEIVDFPCSLRLTPSWMSAG